MKLLAAAVAAAVLVTSTFRDSPPCIANGEVWGQSLAPGSRFGGKSRGAVQYFSVGKNKAKPQMELRGIPSVKDLLAILKKERVPFIEVRVGDFAFGFLLRDGSKEQMEYMQRVLQGAQFSVKEKRRWGKKACSLGAAVPSGTLFAIAYGLNVPRREIFTWLKIPQNTTRIVIAAKCWYLQRILLEEVFHVLEGDDSSGPPPDPLVGDRHHEVINDLLQLFFFPPNEKSFFISPYTNWNKYEKAALQHRYLVEEGFNPNFDLHSIIDKIDADICSNYELTIRGKRMLLADVLFKQQMREARGFSDPERIRRLYLKEAIHYLDRLLKHERFSQYQPLFPQYKFVPAGIEGRHAELARAA